MQLQIIAFLLVECLPFVLTSRGDVSFIAYLDHPLNGWLGKVVVFNRVVINDGNGYNPYTGMFTCPRSGMYLFSFMVNHKDGKGETDFKLVKNSQHIIGAVVETYHPGQDLQGGNTAPLRLNVGDSVYVELMYGQHIMGYVDFRVTSFSGVFLYA